MPSCFVSLIMMEGKTELLRGLNFSKFLPLCTHSLSLSKLIINAGTQFMLILIKLLFASFLTPLTISISHNTSTCSLMRRVTPVNFSNQLFGVFTHLMYHEFHQSDHKSSSLKFSWQFRFALLSPQNPLSNTLSTTSFQNWHIFSSPHKLRCQRIRPSSRVDKRLGCHLAVLPLGHCYWIIWVESINMVVTYNIPFRLICTFATFDNNNYDSDHLWKLALAEATQMNYRGAITWPTKMCVENIEFWAMKDADLMSIGNLFQLFGVADWKACKPNLFWWMGGKKQRVGWMEISG